MVPTSDIDAASFNTSDTPDAPDNLHLSIVVGRGARQFALCGLHGLIHRPLQCSRAIAALQDMPGVRLFVGLCVASGL